MIHIHIILRSSKDLDRITQAGAIIDHYHNGNEVHILATESQYYIIINAGINIKKIEIKQQYYLELLEETRDSDNPMRDYHDYNELTEFLVNISNTYPSITNLISIGQSVQGRNFGYLKYQIILE